MTTPEQLLADPSWRRRHSIYTLWAIAFGFGFVSLLYTGMRAKKNQWIVWGVVYGVIAMSAIFIGGSLSPADPDAPTPPGVDLIYGAWFIVWIISAIHVFRDRKDWLRWKAAAAGQARWYESPPTVSSSSAPTSDLSEIGLDDPTSEYLTEPRTPATAAPPTPTQRRRVPPPAAAPARLQPDRPLPPPPTSAPSRPADVPKAATEPIDLNTATLDEIAALPGVGVATAHRILDERQRRGGFESVDEAAVAGNVQPHVRSRLQQHAVVSKRQQPKRRGTAGRIVDI